MFGRLATASNMRPCGAAACGAGHFRPSNSHASPHHVKSNMRHVELAHVEQGTSGPPPHTPHLIMSTSRLIMLNSHTDPHCSPCIAEPSLVSAVASVFASIMDSLTEHASSSGLFVGKAVSSTSLHCKCPGSR
mmetsp:Transcript_132979/g.265359  ORF Transcript_132979/g.265359 Transcript_132979/m.265359 type:complete len:133 (-) Transcript_132979:999-1397(-)